jgi:hypothetical protein
MFKLNRELSYIDKVTLINTIKEIALNDLHIEQKSVPFLLEIDLPQYLYGRTAQYEYSDGRIELSHIEINNDIPVNEMIDTIFHELKHVQQIERKPLYFRISNKFKRFLIKHNMYYGIFYSTLFHEVSARHYAKKAMKKFRHELNNILSLADRCELKEKFF